MLKINKDSAIGSVANITEHQANILAPNALGSKSRYRANAVDSLAPPSQKK